MNFKIVQFGLDRYDDKESKSMSQLKKLSKDMNVRYIRIENPPYEWDAPVDKIFKNWRGSYSGRKKNPNIKGLCLTDFEYGCWLSHRQAISLGFADRGHTLVCESDCKILDMDLFKERLIEAVNLFDKNSDYPVIRFEPPFYPTWIKTKFGKQVSENTYECDKIFSSHCYLIHENSKKFFMDLYEEEGWLTSDDWLNYNFGDRNIPFLAFKELLTFQFNGSSCLQKETVNFDETIKNIDETIKKNIT